MIQNLRPVILSKARPVSSFVMMLVIQNGLLVRVHNDGTRPSTHLVCGSSLNDDAAEDICFMQDSRPDERCADALVLSQQQLKQVW